MYLRIIVSCTSLVLVLGLTTATAGAQGGNDSATRFAVTNGIDWITHTDWVCTGVHIANKNAVKSRDLSGHR
jgi:hypothetical protein